MPVATPKHPYARTLKTFRTASGKEGRFYSLPALARQFPQVSRLPVSIRIVLESVLRNCDGKKVTAEHVAQLAQWGATAERTEEIPFVVARVVLQDFTGVPLLADLAAMRNVAAKMGQDPGRIEPLVPVDLVVDHSVMIDHYGTKKSLDLNMKLEFQRNQERYQFMKWGMDAFSTFGVVPPGFGIVHQVNLEYLARGVHKAPAAKAADSLGETWDGSIPRFFQPSIRLASARAGQRLSSRFSACRSCFMSRSWSSVSRMVKFGRRPTSSAWLRRILTPIEWKVPSQGMP